MQEMILKIKFDDEGCYKGHDDNTVELIKNGLEQFLEYDLQSDGVIKDWNVEVIPKDQRICSLCNCVYTKGEWKCASDDCPI